MKFTGMFAKMKGEALAKKAETPPECPKPTGDSDYDSVQRFEFLDEQTDDWVGFPQIQG